MKYEKTFKLNVFLTANQKFFAWIESFWMRLDLMTDFLMNLQVIRLSRSIYIDLNKQNIFQLNASKTFKLNVFWQLIERLLHETSDSDRFEF